MSGDPGYPEDIRQYDNDPRSPFYNDPTETAEFEEKQREMWEERISDINGWFIEAISETNDATLKRLSDKVLACDDPPTEKQLQDIGRMVYVMQELYNWPKDEDVIEAL